jgi:hypothetical protein
LAFYGLLREISKPCVFTGAGCSLTDFSNYPSCCSKLNLKQNLRKTSRNVALVCLFPHNPQKANRDDIAGIVSGCKAALRNIT